MKVLHVLDTSVPDTAGYTTRGYYLITHLNRLGVEPVVLTSERYKGKADSLAPEVIDEVRYYRTPKSHGLMRRIPFLSVKDEIATLNARIRQVAELEKVDLVHAHSPSLIGSAAAGFCTSRGIPLVYEIRAFWEDAAVDRGAFAEWSWQYRLRRAHETNVMYKADRVIVICDGLQKDILARGIASDKVHVVRNGVDGAKFVPLSPDAGLQSSLSLDGRKVIGFVGSFFHFEGLQDLLAAMRIMVERDETLRLLLVGTGQVFDSLEKLVQEYALQDYVRLTGRVPHDDVAKYYSVIDVLVYPRVSKRITELVTPLKPLEAMAMGKPTVMSDVGGLKELVRRPGVAELFSAGNHQELAEVCLALCNDESRRRQIGENARKYVNELWSWESRAGEYLDVYGRLRQG